MPSSRFFDDASNQYLKVDAVAVSGFPFTAAGWVKIDAAGVIGTVFGIADVATTNQYMALWMDDFDNTRKARSFIINGSIDQVLSSNSYVNDQWHLIIGVWTATAITVYLDGANKGTDGNAVSFPSTVDNMTIGMMRDDSPGAPLSGNVCLVGLWNMEFSDADAAALWNGGAGALPTAIQAANLVGYWLDGTESDADHKASNDMTPFNSPTWDSGDWPLAAPSGDIVILRRRRM